jgi:hypothetical protein
MLSCSFVQMRSEDYSMRLRFDATRSASASADNRRTASPCRLGSLWVNARRALPTRTGDLRLAAPSTATARELAKTVAREVPATPADRRTRHRGSRHRKGDAKFSCLQRIEKAQNVEIFSMAEDGLGATKRGRGGSLLAAGFVCARGAAIGARGALEKRRGNFPACNPLKRRKTWKCSR